MPQENSTIMETTVNIKSKPAAVGRIALASLFCCLGVICLVVHVSPAATFGVLADFAVHHYFLAGFICLLIAGVCLKSYLSINARAGASRPERSVRVTRRSVAIANMKKRAWIASRINESIYVRKEKIEALRFRPEEVLQSADARRHRFETLQKALSLGNVYRQKVIICFMADTTVHHTLGTVWYADEQHVSLKGGATLPVNRILKVEI